MSTFRLRGEGVRRPSSGARVRAVRADQLARLLLHLELKDVSRAADTAGMYFTADDERPLHVSRPMRDHIAEMEETLRAECRHVYANYLRRLVEGYDAAEDEDEVLAPV